MSKQGFFHCFINYTQVYPGKETITTTSTFHFSGKASEEKEILSIGAVCSALLGRLGIKHDVNFCFKPAFDRDYFVDGSEKIIVDKEAYREIK